MPLQKPQSGAKRKLRKARCIKQYIPWTGLHKETQKRANRRARHHPALQAEINEVKMVLAESRKSHDEGKVQVASNRCGNECGRRASLGDYLCSRCRQ